MVDEVANVALAFDARGAQEGAARFAASGEAIIGEAKKVEGALKGVGASAAQMADEFPPATTRIGAETKAMARSFDALTGRVDPLGRAVRKAQADLNDLAKAASGTGVRAGEAASLIGAATSRLTAAMRAQNDSVGKIIPTFGAATESASRFSQVMSGIGNASGGGLGSAFATGGAFGLGIAAATAAAAALAAVIKSIPAAGDAARQSIARLSATIGDTRQAADAFERLQALSAQTGVSVADAAGAFQRFGIAARDVGATNSQVLDLVSGLQKFAIVSGASTSETQSATTQLAQALASGKLQGDELRSILESMPLFASALARELGTSVGGLRAMGTEGKLSSDVIFPAILRTVEGIDDVFGRMPVTLARATQQFTAASDALLARMDDALGISAKLISAFQTAANLANSIRRGIGGSTNVEREAELIVKFNKVQEEIQARKLAIADVTAAGGKGDSDGLALLQRDLSDQIAASEKFRKELLAIGNQRVLDDEAAEIAAGEARLSAANDNSTKEIEELRKKNDKKYTAQKEYNDAIKTLDEARNLGTVTENDYVSLQITLQATLDEALKKGTETRTAHTRAVAAAVPVTKELVDTYALSIQAAEQDVQAQRRLLAAYDGTSKSLVTARNHNRARAEVLKTLNAQHADFAGNVAHLAAKFDDASEAAGKLEHAQQSVQAVSNMLETAFDRLGQGLVDAFLSGKDAAINFGSIAKAIASSLISDFAKLAIISPLRNMVFGGSAPTFGAAFSALGSGGAAAQSTSGGGMMGNLSNVSSLASLSDALGITSIKDTLLGWGNSLGITGNGGLLGGLNSLLGTTVFTGPTGSLAASAGAEFGIGAAASAGVPVSLGSLLGGAGAGFAIGSIGGGLLQNSMGKTGPAPTIGAGVGAVGGALIGSIFGPAGALLGGILGGTVGGGAGGLIGPKKASSFSSTGLGISATGGIDIGQTVSQIADTTAELAQLQAQVGQINQLLAASGAVITSLGGVSQIGQNTPSGFQDPSKAAGIDDAFSGLRFSAPGNDTLNRAISGRSFGAVADLAGVIQEVTTFVDQVVPALKKLGQPNQFGIGAIASGLDEIKTQFDAAIATAQRLGYAESDLVAAREQALTVATANAQQVLNDIDSGLSQRLLAATAAVTGKSTDALTAAMSAFDAAAAGQRKQFDAELLTLLGDQAKTHESYTSRMAALETALGEERLAIVKSYNDKIAETQMGIQRGIEERVFRLSGNTASAQLHLLGINAATEIETLRKSLTDLGSTSEHIANTISVLTAVQAAERQAFLDNLGAQWQDMRTGLLSREAAVANDNTPLQLQLFDAKATAEVDALRRQIIALGASGSAVTDTLARLVAVQSVERKAIVDQAAAIEKARQEQQSAQLRATQVGIEARVIQAGGNSQPGQLRLFDMQAVDEVDALRKSLTDLGLTAAQVSGTVASLTAAQAQERAALVNQGNQARLDSNVSLLAREVAAKGNKVADQLYLFDVQAGIEVSRTRDELIRLGFSTEEVTRNMAKLVQIQGLERAALQEQAADIENTTRNTAAGTASGVIRSITDYARGLQFGSESPLSATAQLDAANRQFDAVRGAAAAGDFASAQQLTGFAEVLRSAARNVFGSGVGYVDVIKKITDALEPISTMAPERLITSVITTETRAQTQTLSADLMELKSVLIQVRDSIRAGSGAPPASRAA